MEKAEDACYTRQQDVMGLVIRRLYFGKRPSQKDLATNGSILKRLNTTRGYDWEACARIVEGLALLRDQGKLEPTIPRTKPVDLRWVWDKDRTLNQAETCQDAYYASRPKSEPARTKGGAVTSITDILLKARTAWHDSTNSR
jgi:hypothetical protein